MKLAQLQELFYERITMGSVEVTSTLDPLIVGSAELPAATRLQVYADMYRWRLLDVLREDFPKLAALVGHNAFCELAAAYVRAHPSKHHDIGQVGRLLSAFLRAHRHLALRADAVDLAELEWARARVLHGGSSTPIRREAFLALTGESAATAHLQLTPNLQLLRLDYDVVKIFRELDNGSKAGAPLATPTAVVVWRPEYEVFHASIEPSEANALECACLGASFVQICDAFAGDDDPVQSAFAAIGSWCAEGLVTSLR